MILKKIKKFWNKYGVFISILIAILTILTLTGFDINIPKFYNSLNTEAKIIFVGFSNVVFTLIVVIILSNKIDKVKKN
jgi:hypothetical protein